MTGAALTPLSWRRCPRSHESGVLQQKNLARSFAAAYFLQLHSSTGKRTGLIRYVEPNAHFLLSARRSNRDACSRRNGRLSDVDRRILGVCCGARSLLYLLK